MEHQTLGQWDDHPIDPANQRIILKIVGFQVTIWLCLLNTHGLHCYKCRKIYQNWFVKLQTFPSNTTLKSNLTLKITIRLEILAKIIKSTNWWKKYYPVLLTLPVREAIEWPVHRWRTCIVSSLTSWQSTPPGELSLLLLTYLCTSNEYVVKFWHNVNMKNSSQINSLFNYF